MTDINSIISDNWDATIVTAPTIADELRRSRNTMNEGITTLISNTSDMVIGILDRSHLDPDSYDGYICWVISATEANLLKYIKAIKKVCAEYTPTSDENVLKWEGGDWKIFNNKRFEFQFVLIVYKAGIQLYT
jgi:hypothetical protein